MTSFLACIAETRTGKILLVLWALILTTGIVIIFADQFSSKIFGQIAVVSILILFNASMILTQIVNKGAEMIAKILWIVLCVVVIVVLLTIPDPLHPDARRDTEIFLIYAMLALTSPSGFLVPLFFGACSWLVMYLFGLFDKEHWLDFGIVNLYVSNVTMWAGFVVIGYLQWFVLLPWLIRKWKVKRALRTRLSI